MKVLLILIVGLTLVTPLIRQRKVDDWWRNQKIKAKIGRSLNFTFEIPSHREIPFRPQFRFRPRPVTRKEYRCLNNLERSNVQKALQKTKETMEGPLSQYDYFVSQHESSRARGAHFGPAFAPWHRHYLYQYVF